MIRELRNVMTEKVVGTVAYQDGELQLDGAAGPLFANFRRQVGDARLGEDLMGNGWSNGYLYLAEPQ
jgi:hypothetical protein